jgi:hypothetical protein
MRNIDLRHGFSYLIRLAVEKSGEEYLSYPQRALFEKIGVRTMRIETDPFGNFLGQGYEVGSGRDWGTSISRTAYGTAVRLSHEWRGRPAHDHHPVA